MSTQPVYRFEKGKNVTDSNIDIIKITPTSEATKLSEFEKACNDTIGCAGYNSFGWLKKRISNITDGLAMPGDKDGLYINTGNTCRNQFVSEKFLRANCLNTTIRNKNDVIEDIKYAETAEAGLNTLFVFYTITDYKSITNDTFAYPSHIQYRKGIAVDNRSLLPGLVETQNYAMKISTFITIDRSTYFNLSVSPFNGIVKFYLDNVLLGTNAYGYNLNINNIYISKGVHYVYIETTIGPRPAYNNVFSCFLTYKDGTGNSSMSIDRFITTPYTLLTNIANAKNTADLNYCKTGGLLTDAYCKDILKTKTLLNTEVKNKCFNASGDYMQSADCDDLIKNTIKNDGTVNSELTTSLNTSVQNYINNKFKILDSMPQADKDKFRDFYIMVNDASAGKYVGLDQKDASGNVILPIYCEKTVGDVYNIPNDKTNLCNYVYNNTNISTLAPISDSYKNIKSKYCKTNVNGKYRYETDPSCQATLKTGTDFNTDIKARCIADGKFKIDDVYCNSLVDNNINSTTPAVNSTLLTDLTTSKNDFMKNEISNISTANPTLKTLDYATTTYKKYSKTSDDVLQTKLLDYCEVNDPLLSLDNPCRTVYNTYNTDQKIIDSRSRMRANNCAQPAYINTNNNTQADIDKNINNCKSLTFDTSNIANISKNASSVNAYCSTDKNIVTDDCKNYYSGIEDKILEAQFGTVKSGFENKESMEDGEYYDDNNLNAWLPILAMILLVLVAALFISLLPKKSNRVSAAGELRRNTKLNESIPLTPIEDLRM